MAAPLVLLSHGHGGSGLDLVWFARALTDAGLRAIALDRPQDREVRGPITLLYQERTRQAQLALDDLTRVESRRPAGVAGFSLAASPPPPWLERAWTEQSKVSPDPRVGAAFLMAPALGDLVDPASLAQVAVPVAVCWGGADTITPYDTDVAPYLRHIPEAEGRSLGEGVRHEDFLEGGSADPAAREAAAAHAVAFFQRHLGSTMHSAAHAAPVRDCGGALGQRQ